MDVIKKTIKKLEDLENKFNHMRVISFMLLMLLFTSCKYEQNTEDFNNIIISYYKDCPNKDSCIIDLSKTMAFDWEKMYIFSNENYPEADQEVIREITGTSYSGKREYLENRSILFVKDSTIVYEVLTPYESDGAIDTKPMYIGFAGQNIPDYFLKEDSKFIITPYENDIGFNLKHLEK